jgi:phage terminase small subunit
LEVIPMGERGPKPVIQKKGFSEKRPGPRQGMTLRAQRIWREVVASLPPTHFRPGDYPLLRGYCEAEALHFEACQKIAEEGAVVTRKKREIREDGTVIETELASKANPWVAIQTAKANEMSMLATKLRLCVNSRVTNKKAGHEQEPPKSTAKGNTVWDK